MKVELEEGHNGLVFETQDGTGQVLVSPWVEDGKVVDIQVALRPYRGATWGIPLKGGSCLPA